MNDVVVPLPERGIRILRLRLIGVVKNYEVDFTSDQGTHRDLSIIAGRLATGKTTVLRFINYVFGGSSFPSPPEVIRQVRSALVEVATPDGVYTLERALGANNVYILPGRLDEIDPVQGTSHIVDPINDPNSVSQWLLTTVGLQDVVLKEAPTKEESAVDHLGFRDLMWTVLYLNERVGSQQLLHAGQFMKEQKLRQTVDAIFGVHDNEQADLARRIRDASVALESQRKAVALLQEFVAQQQPGSIDGLELEAERVDRDLSAVAIQLRELTQKERAASTFADELRVRQAELAESASRANQFLRDRKSLVSRFASLRAQYADDIRKLTLLVEANLAFDELSVVTCPACLNPLLTAPTVDGGVCSLCHQPVTNERSAERIDASKSELAAAKRRYKELDDYWQRLIAELPRLEANQQQTQLAESEAAALLDESTRNAVSPFSAARDQLQLRRQASLVIRNGITSGIKLLTGLEARVAQLERAERNLTALRSEQRDARQRPDRDEVLREVNSRFSAILHFMEYPKVDEAGVLPPYLDSKLVPYVRGQHFKEASSGGQVLISLAWMLSIFEVAYEQRAAHPGLLMIDTPQKNLGGAADDAAFADIHLIERFYDHLTHWLAGSGKGAQVIVVDNTPPTNVAADIAVRYTRDPQEPPFGLIDNETGLEPPAEAEGAAASDE